MADPGPRHESVRSLETLLREEGARLFSGRIDVETGGIVGVIHMSEGQVLDVRLGTVQGEPALWRLLLHENPRIVLEAGRPRATSGTVLGHPDALLQRFAERLALLDVYANKVGGFQRVWAIRYDALARILDGLPDAINPMLRLIDGRRTVRQVVTESALDDVLALRVLGRLLIEGVLILPDAPLEQSRSSIIDAPAQGLAAVVASTATSLAPAPTGSDSEAPRRSEGPAPGPNPLESPRSATGETSEPPDAVMPPPRAPAAETGAAAASPLESPPPSHLAQPTVAPTHAQAPRVVTMMPRDVSVPPDTTLPVVTALPSAPPIRSAQEVQSWLGRDDFASLPPVAQPSTTPMPSARSGVAPNHGGGVNILAWAALLLGGVLLGMLIAQKAC